MAPGKLIVFEGPEGVGKSTQLERLLARFAAMGLPCVTFREPGGTPAGEQIRGILLGAPYPISARAEALLFMAARAELCATEIVPALARGEHVLLDRFFLSTYAYQIGGRGLPEEDVRKANRLATGGLVPDLTLLFDYPVLSGLERASGRSAQDRMEREGRVFYERVGTAFATFASDEWSAAHPECGRIARIDASGSEEEVQAHVLRAVMDILPTTFSALA